MNSFSLPAESESSRDSILKTINSFSRTFIRKDIKDYYIQAKMNSLVNISRDLSDLSLPPYAFHRAHRIMLQLRIFSCSSSIVAKQSWRRQREGGNSNHQKKKKNVEDKCPYLEGFIYHSKLSKIIRNSIFLFNLHQVFSRYSQKISVHTEIKLMIFLIV